jgi:hypothetical protein
MHHVVTTAADKFPYGVGQGIHKNCVRKQVWAGKQSSQDSFPRKKGSALLKILAGSITSH